MSSKLKIKQMTTILQNVIERLQNPRKEKSPIDY